jgi:ATP phosphoribosyltransferase
MKLSLGLPKGSLQKSTLELFQKAGIHIQASERSYYPSCDDPELDLIFMRPQEIPRYVQDGVLDAGITGYDWTVENRADVVTVCELEYSKVSRNKCRWVLAVPEDSPFQKAEDLKNCRVATELVKTTEEYFAKKNVPVQVEFSWGATEVKPPRLVDAIVDITETGSSLRANRLKIIEVLMETSTIMIANKGSWEESFKQDKLKSIKLLLEGSLDAENYVGLKCNATSQNLGPILEVLPALHKPTVSNLSDDGWVAVETIIPVKEIKTLIPKIKAAGAEGIIEYPIHKIIR